MEHRQVAYRASLVCLAGGTMQLVYGVLAIVFPYPRIIEHLQFDVLWALANVGMIGGVVGLLALDVARPQAMAKAGGVIAVLGHAARAAISLIPTFPGIDAAVVATIVPMFLGMGLLGIATLRGKRLTGWQAWAPLLTLAAGFITASVYSVDKHIHFILLGLFWGLTWLLVGSIVFRQANKRGEVAPAQSSGATTTT